MDFYFDGYETVCRSHCILLPLVIEQALRMNFNAFWHSDANLGQSQLDQHKCYNMHENMTQSTWGFLICPLSLFIILYEVNKVCMAVSPFLISLSYVNRDKSTHALNEDGHVSFCGDYGETFYNKPRKFSIITSRRHLRLLSPLEIPLIAKLLTESIQFNSINFV